MNVAQLIAALQQCKDQNKQIVFNDVDSPARQEKNAGKFASVCDTSSCILINHSFETLNYTGRPNGLQGPNRQGVIWTD